MNENLEKTLYTDWIIDGLSVGYLNDNPEYAGWLFNEQDKLKAINSNVDLIFEPGISFGSWPKQEVECDV